MNYNWKEAIPESFGNESRVWVYQANRPFTTRESVEILEILRDFTSTWLSHGARVTGYANLLFSQFVVIMADEAMTGVSGCSTDSSVAIVRNIEEKFQVNMFDRLQLAFHINEKVKLLPLSELNEAGTKEILGPETLYFNNTILTKADLLQHWLIPVKNSWLAKKVGQNLDSRPSVAGSEGH